MKVSDIIGMKLTFGAKVSGFSNGGGKVPDAGGEAVGKGTEFRPSLGISIDLGGLGIRTLEASWFL